MAQDPQGPDEQNPPPANEPAAPDAKQPDVVAESAPGGEKLADPVETGKMATAPAASGEKTAESAAPAPEGAQPAQPTAPAAKAAKPAAARPAKEAEPKHAPRETPPPGSLNEVIAASLPDISIAAAYMVPALTGESVAIELKRDDVPAVLQLCRDDARLSMDYLRCLSGVDWQAEGLEVVYHLWSFEKRHELTVKTRVTYDDAVVPSVAAIYPGADWHERETRDMYGIDFSGHPNLVPLLLPDDMTDHFPLRKDIPLQEIEEWQGENLREGAGEGEE